MSTDVTTLANQALGHLAHTKFLADYTADTSKVKLVLDKFYDTALARAFRDFDWPFAVFIDDLVATSNPNATEWAYAYEYPADAARITRIVSGVWPEPPSARVAYRIIGHTTADSGRRILTNQQDAQAEFVVPIDEPEAWPSDFAEAFALLWAGLSAPGITGGDQHKLGARALALYDMALRNAFLNHMNEERPPQPPESEFITSRY